jgi:type I restriction enzyme R subunit
LRLTPSSIRNARKEARRFVESHDHAIRLKAEIMVDHFHEQVIALHKLGGEARAMVVTSGIERAIQYYHAIRSYLSERKAHFGRSWLSGKHEYGGAEVTEATLNGFGSRYIADNIAKDPYRFLVCADKFQTGYDEPLLHTMYVDKALSGIKAVQTLSRINRSHPDKRDVFVLDFQNDVETIRASFEPYYRTTILSEETDPNTLHDVKAALDGYQIYSEAQIDELVRLYLGGAARDSLDPILTAASPCTRNWMRTVKSTSRARLRLSFGRTAISRQSCPTRMRAGRRSRRSSHFVPKLPAPREEDGSEGIAETIDMDSYRIESVRRYRFNYRMPTVRSGRRFSTAPPARRNLSTIAYPASWRRLTSISATSLGRTVIVFTPSSRRKSRARSQTMPPILTRARIR